MIYVFGNSHAHSFTDSTVHLSDSWGDKENSDFKSYSLGPVIAYNFLEHHLERLLAVISTIDIKENDYILLAIGEVDCRWHLPYQASLQNKSNYDIVNECLDRFFRSYIELKSKGYNVIGWSGHPSTTSEHCDDPQQPIFGDCLNRNEISLIWDNILSNKCKENNIPYVSIIKELINNDGLTKMEYFSDYCHLNYSKIKDILYLKFEEYI
jgi:hypothetical protein